MADQTKTKIDVQKLINHLKEKWQGRPCPMCQVGNWNVNDTVFELREFHGGGMVIGGGPIYPVVPVSCNNCGHTVLVNAVMTGLVVRAEKGAQ